MMSHKSTQKRVDAITTQNWCDMQAPELIQRAEVAAQGTSALARTLGVPQQHVTDWKANRRTCPPDMRARMAAMCGLDPVAEAIEAIAEGLNDARRSGLLEAIESSEVAGANFYDRKRPGVDSARPSISQAEPDSSTRLKIRLSALSALIASGLKSWSGHSRHAAPPQPA